MTDMTENAQARPAAAANDEPRRVNQAEANAVEAVGGNTASQPAQSSESTARGAKEDVPPIANLSPQSEPATAALTAARAQAEWRVIGETVPGASHLRAGIPNQDAILHVRQSSVRLPLIVSISDGHGSNKCFRSDRGSRFAVRVGCDLLDKLINGRHAALPPSEIAGRVRESLTAEFIKRWRAAVDVDLKREPFREEEFARMVEKDGVNARRLVESNPYLAYGATSLSLLLTSTYALYLQLGDGEMLTVSAQGEISQPLPEDARLLANETTSLCLERAAEDFLFAVHPHGEGDLPALILMTTDGYYNSFSTIAGFHQVGSDLIEMLREDDGFDTVSSSVKGWLEEATAAGSGDDCTLAIICRMDALKAPSTLSDATLTTASPHTASSETPFSPSTGAPDSSTSAASHEQSAAPKTA